MCCSVRGGIGELRKRAKGLVKGIDWYAREKDTQLTRILSGEKGE
jgi:hypothetical protein